MVDVYIHHFEAHHDYRDDVLNIRLKLLVSCDELRDLDLADLNAARTLADLARVFEARPRQAETPKVSQSLSCLRKGLIAQISARANMLESQASRAGPGWGDW